MDEYVVGAELEERKAALVWSVDPAGPRFDARGAQVAGRPGDDQSWASRSQGPSAVDGPLQVPSDGDSRRTSLAAAASRRR